MSRGSGSSIIAGAFYTVLLVSGITVLGVGMSGTSLKNDFSIKTNAISAFKKLTYFTTLNDGGIPDYGHLENCTVSFEPQRRNEWGTRPFLFVEQGFSFDHEIIKSTINQLTGLGFGAKLFYVTNQQHRRCFSKKSETAACFIGHTLDEYKEKYQRKVVYMLRNPQHAYPLTVNKKAEKYSGQERGVQVPISTWRQFRNEYMDDFVEEWTAYLDSWHHTDYEMGMYLSYERLMDFRTGPNTLIELANLLRSHHFQTADAKDIPCIWYQSIGKQKLEKYRKYNFEYTDYTPGYTKSQKEQLLGEMSSLMMVYHNESDSGLHDILQEYYADIRDNTVIDTLE